MVSSNKTNRTPWIVVGVLGCLALCLICVVVMGIVWVFHPFAPTPIASTSPSPMNTPSPTFSAPASATGSSSSSSTMLPDPKAATVLVQVAMDSGGFSSGSGSIVREDGIVLTCFHVIGDNNTGRFYNKDRVATVGTVSLPNGVIIKRYRAAIILWDAKLDIAVLRIVAQEDGSSLPISTVFPWVQTGNSDSIKIDSRVSVYGFPTIAQDSNDRSILYLNATAGVVSGFETEGGQEQGKRTWIKMSTQLNSGASGGMAVDDRGQLIGIPSRVKSSGTQQGFQQTLSYLIPINLAIPLLQQIDSPQTPTTPTIQTTASPTKPPPSPTLIPEITPPPGLYALAIRPETSVMRMQGDIPILGQKQEVYFIVTFLNTTGAARNERWFVYIYQGPVGGGGKPIGQTSSDLWREIPPGRSEQKTTNGWGSGQGRSACADYWARVHTLLFDQALKDIDIRAPFEQQTRQAFQVCP